MGRLSGNLIELKQFPIPCHWNPWRNIFMWCSGRSQYHCLGRLNQSMLLATRGLKCDYAPWQSWIHPVGQLLIISTLMQDGGTTPTLAVLVQNTTNCIFTKQADAPAAPSQQSKNGQIEQDIAGRAWKYRTSCRLFLTQRTLWWFPSSAWFGSDYFG